MNIKQICSRRFYFLFVLLNAPWQQLKKIIFNVHFRRYIGYMFHVGMLPRFQPGTVRIGSWRLTFADAASFLSAYNSIFVESCYDFISTRADNPHILDCGANIGLGTLFFKQRYPDSTVIAYEADPQIFQILKKNIADNHLSNIELHNVAIWSSDTILQFAVEGADAGHVDSGVVANAINIPSISLVSILKNSFFDFVKIDIEGAEYEALQNCAEVLCNADRYFIEYHSFIGKPQELGRLISLFEQRNFRCHIVPEHFSFKPFISIKSHYGMDLQLNLYFQKNVLSGSKS